MSKWISNYFHMNDSEKMSGKVFCTRVMISVLCMMTCMIAMLSSAYAWFLIDISSSDNMLSAANYSLDITTNAEVALLDAESGIDTYDCELVYNDEHYFTLTATGTASRGYCQIIVTDYVDGEERVSTYYTTPIEQGESLEVCIQAAKDSTIEFVPVWGTYEAQATYSLRPASVFSIQHSTTPYVEYLVEERVSLEDIADYYGVSVEDICIYNDITELVVGDIIKIPGIVDDSIDPYVKASPSNAAKVEKETPSNAKKVEVVRPVRVEKLEKATPANVAKVKKEILSAKIPEKMFSYSNPLEKQSEVQLSDVKNETITVASDANAADSQ